MVTVGKPFVVVVGIGTGNSPPARKRAASPDSVVKFGSASRRANPFVSNAEISKSTEPPLLVRMRLVNKLPNGAGATPPAVPKSVPTVPSIGRLPVGEAPTGVPPVLPTGFSTVLIPPIGRRPVALVAPPSPVFPTLVPLAFAA